MDTECSGYVINKTQTQFVIKLNDNDKTIIGSKIPEYDEYMQNYTSKEVLGGIFEPNQTFKGITFSIIEYAPICVFISKR